MMDREDPEGFAGIRSGNVTGGVYEWHPGGELALVEGTELSGANGIVVSDDERYLYVAALGSGELVRFDRETLPMGKQVVALPITPDNIRWGDDGMLYTAGGDRGGPGQAGWSVVRVDPAKLEARRIAGAPAGTALGGVSVALPAGDEIWIGTFSGDRVGILPRP
jgi:sugar lactone lactonase YvrE